MHKMCIAKCSFLSSSNYLTLSYVLGCVNLLQLASSNKDILVEAGALTNHLVELPKVIQDAISLVSAMNEKCPHKLSDGHSPLCLWVDQLCMIQNDPAFKAIQFQ